MSALYFFVTPGSSNVVAVGPSFTIRVPKGWQDISAKRSASPNEALLAFVPRGDELTNGPIVSPNGALIVASDDGVSDDPETGIQTDIDKHRGIELGQKQERYSAGGLITTVQTVRWQQPMTETFVYQNVEQYFSIDRHILCIAMTYRQGNPKSAQFENALREVVLSVRRRTR
jgi:hypothetical protein